jgi:hypothetical protein
LRSKSDTPNSDSSSRSWCDTGSVVRVRKAGPVEVDDPDAVPKKR